jgi:hypothetical protein
VIRQRSRAPLAPLGVPRGRSRTLLDTAPPPLDDEIVGPLGDELSRRSTRREVIDAARLAAHQDSARRRPQARRLGAARATSSAARQGPRERAAPVRLSVEARSPPGFVVNLVCRH